MLATATVDTTGVDYWLGDRWSRAQRLARFCAMLGIFTLWLIAFSPTGVGGPVGMIWVSGTSMEPGLHTGDLVVTYQQDSYDVGDVVAFEIPEGGTVIHRIIEVTNDGLYRFQGDNRKYDDPWSLGDEMIVGAAVTSLPKAATIVQWLSRPLMLALMVSAISALYAWPYLSDDSENQR